MKFMQTLGTLAHLTDHEYNKSLQEIVTNVCWSGYSGHKATLVLEKRDYLKNI